MVQTIIHVVLTIMGNLDERLLAATEADRQRQEEMANADRLRQEKMAATDKEKQKESVDEKTGEPQSLRQRVQAARQALNIKEQAKKKLEEKITAPAKSGTSKLLRYSWLNIIDSFGLTLIYINIHVFLRWVLGDKLFCKLGEEWLPKKITEAGGEAGKMPGKIMGLTEVMVLMIVDFIALIIILAALGIIVMIVDFMQASFWDKFLSVIGGLTKIGWSGIEALYNLFTQ